MDFITDGTFHALGFAIIWAEQTKDPERYWTEDNASTEVNDSLLESPNAVPMATETKSKSANLIQAQDFNVGLFTYTAGATAIKQPNIGDSYNVCYQWEQGSRAVVVGHWDSSLGAEWPDTLPKGSKFLTTDANGNPRSGCLYYINGDETRALGWAEIYEVDLGSYWFDDPAPTAASYLLLGCPNASVLEKDNALSIKPRLRRKSNHYVDDKKALEEAADFQGMIFDYAQIAKHGVMLQQQRGVEAKFSSKSRFDEKMSCKEAADRIKEWLGEEGVNRFVFYFSGNGSAEGMGFSDGILSYKELAELVGGAKFNVPSDSDEKKDDEVKTVVSSATVTVVVDACFSGGIVEAFKGLNEKGVGFELFYSSQSDQKSYELRKPTAGCFTSWLFAEDRESEWKKHLMDPTSSTFGTSASRKFLMDQRSGYYISDSMAKSDSNGQTK